MAETEAIAWLIYLAILIVSIGGLWKMFEKAGEPGWAAIVPIYNTYMMIKVSGNPNYFLLLYFVPIIALYPAIKVPWDLAKQFGKGGGYGLGMIFLPFVFMPLLGFGDAEYQG